ncbi:transposase [Geofilum rubicundum]|uniref:transposase n=1 Tax=Geofilum rubicundum TaxID=472113 RepID=UPI001D0E76CC|nr:transposase [Geofilum rubicundum]
MNYKERWQIETMCRAMKSIGFNMEDTHLTDLNRLSTLVAIIAIAFVWAYLVGIDKHKNINSIKLKKHGRRHIAFLNMGLLELRIPS